MWRNVGQCVQQEDVIVIEGAKSFYQERDGGDWFKMRRGEESALRGGRCAERSHIAEFKCQMFKGPLHAKMNLCPGKTIHF